MKLLIVLLLSLPAFAQDITDVFAIFSAAKSTTAVIAAVTGTDGTICTLSKVSAPTIDAIFRCNSADGKTLLKSAAITSTSTATSSVLLAQGQVLCLVGVNPTAAAVTMGSLGSVPASGIAYACTPGDGTIKNGTATWP